MKSWRSYNYKKTAGATELAVDERQALSRPLRVHASHPGSSWLHRVTQKVSSGPYSGGSLYHGTNKTFDSFDMSFAGARDWGDYGVGVYLGTIPGLAISYAHEAVKNNGGGVPVVYVVRANLTNVANFDELMEGIRAISVPEQKDPSQFRDDGMQSRPEGDSRGITEYMTSLGFDAAMVGTEVCVYDPSLLSITRVVSVKDAQGLP